MSDTLDKFLTDHLRMWKDEDAAGIYDNRPDLKPEE